MFWSLHEQTFCSICEKRKISVFVSRFDTSINKVNSLCSLRLGLYEPSKNLCELALESTNILVKIGYGAASGAFVTLLTNPMEVLKVNMFMR